MVAIYLFLALGFVCLGADHAAAASRSAFIGTYMANLLNLKRAEIVSLHGDGTAGMSLSDQVTGGAGQLTFSDSYGAWEPIAPHRVKVRMVNMNFFQPLDSQNPDQAPVYSGPAVVDYVFQFAPNFNTFTLTCSGKVYSLGVDPFDPNAVPDITFDCTYFNGNVYKRVSP
jgi:hypothetical protein